MENLVENGTKIQFTYTDYGCE